MWCMRGVSMSVDEDAAGVSMSVDEDAAAGGALAERAKWP
jgi:hypothetical protein